MTNTEKRLKKCKSVVSIEKLSLTSLIKKRLGPKLARVALRNSRGVRVYKMVYRSNGHNVFGYIVEPISKGKLPCVVYNRGGSFDFGLIKIGELFLELAEIAKWGYVVIASQYSGNSLSEGKDEHGGKDLDDVLNLRKILDCHPRANTKKIGMYGASRGGTMTYLSLTRAKWIKTAVSLAGASDYVRASKLRPEMFEIYKESFGGSVKEMKKRSAVYWPEKFPKKVPLLLFHGTADWRVSPLDSIDLSALLYERKVPHRLVLFEGGDHGLNEFREEYLGMIKNWFDKYLKKDTKINLKPHGL